MRTWTPEELVYLGPSDEVREHILATLLRIPDHVAKFAVDHCIFTSVGGPGDIRGLILPRGEADDRWIIVLLEASELDSEELMSAVAEEVAHGFLGHRYLEGCDEHEAAAAALIQSWGFRASAMPDLGDA